VHVILQVAYVVSILKRARKFGGIVSEQHIRVDDELYSWLKEKKGKYGGGYKFYEIIKNELGLTKNMYNLYTIGYEGRKLDEFIKILNENKVELLIDLREFTASNHKPDFSKDNLKKVLPTFGIGYLWIRDLGSPKKMRDILYKTGDYNSFFEEYTKYMDRKQFSLERVLRLSKIQSICLMCYEADYNFCHRLIVAERIKEMGGNGLKITNL
jgi:hypothetical protein